MSTKTLIAGLVAVGFGSAASAGVVGAATPTTSEGFGSNVLLADAPGTNPDGLNEFLGVQFDAGDLEVVDFAFFNTDGFVEQTPGGDEVEAGDDPVVIDAFVAASGSGISSLTIGPQADFGGNNDILLNGEGVGTIRSSNAAGTIDLSGLEPGTTGTIFFIGGQNDNDLTNITLGGVTGTVEGFTDGAGGGPQQSFVLAFEFDTTDNGGILEFAYETIEEGQILGDAGNDGSRTRFQGIVVSAVPEPGSLALLGLGGMAMLTRRRSAK